MRPAGTGRHILCGWLLALSACASQQWQVGAPLAAPAQAQARQTLQARPPAPNLWAGNGTLMAFSHGERVRARVQLLVAAPRRFRLTAVGPHNAAVWVVASDGTQLRAFDVGKRELHSAAATREGLASLAQGLDIGMPIEAWLSLLGFALPIPADAQAFARPHGQVAWAWTEAGHAAALGTGMQALVDDKGRVVSVRVPNPDGGEVQASFLPASRDDAPAVAKEIDVRVANAHGQSDSSFSLSLEDIVVDPHIASDKDPFVLSVP